MQQTPLRRLDVDNYTKNRMKVGAHVSLRDECLNETLFSSLRDARYELSRWREDYNQVRPHSALGNLSPAEFVEKLAHQKLAA